MNEKLQKKITSLYEMWNQYFIGGYDHQLTSEKDSKEIKKYGFKLKKEIPNDVWNQMGFVGTLKCVYPSWYLIIYEN
jgi:hypothetical protein